MGRLTVMQEQLTGVGGHSRMQHLGKREAGGREVRKDGLRGGNKGEQAQRRKEHRGLQAAYSSRPR